MSDRTGGPEYFRLFAQFARGGLSPLYERLTLAIADDPEMLAFAAQARPGQPQANILFGAVHALLLGVADHPLKDYFPSCGGTKKASEDDSFAAFKDFVAQNRAYLEPFVKTRITNTNEVGRSALIYPALDIVARESGAPLSIIEVGPSAGLNLNWHRYGYRYTDEAGALAIARGASDGLLLESRLKGAHRPTLAPRMPVVAAAFGLEQSPVDLSSAEERLWLRALIWPERIDRLARLDAALAVAAAHPPEIVKGDAVRDLAASVARYPAGAPVTLVHTLVTYQFDAAAQAAFESAISAAARDRPIWRVAVDWDGTGYPIALSRYDGANRSDRKLAACDPHGGWIEWLNA